MIEIAPNVFVGNQLDYETRVKHEPDWSVVHACKEPYHRKALGYDGRGAPRDDPEYLVAERGNRLILNLVDVDDVKYIDPGMIERAVTFIEVHRAIGRKVLVHCNQGGSRAPSIGLLYLARNVYRHHEPEAALAHFQVIYPQYLPAQGMRDFVQQNWRRYAA